MSATNTVTPPAPAARPEAATAAQRRDRIIELVRGQGLVVVLVALVVFFHAKSEFFLTSDNFEVIATTAAGLGVMAIAQTLLVVSGGIDISVGGVVALSSVVLGLLDKNGVSIWVAVLLTLLLGGGIGLVNGLLIIRLKIDPLVTTLGTLSITQGLGYVISSTNTLILQQPDYSTLGTGHLVGIPIPVVLCGVVLAVGLFVERLTPTGRKIYAIGGNLEAARLSGLRIDRIRWTLYALSGMSAALAGAVITAQLGSSSPQIGTTFLLSVITAVILGGASLQGGRGSIVGTTVAIAILGVLQNGFGLLRVSSYTQQIVLGALLIAAVLLDQTGRALRRS
jgi:ribose transport system permease protein